MTRRSLRVVVLMAAFIVLAAGDCDIGDLGDILDEPGQVTVTNESATELAIISITADDVKSYPSLAAGSSASVKSNTGGNYQVQVVMTPAQTIEYRSSLASLRQQVESQIAGTNDAAAKVQLFTQLAGLKASIAQASDASGASCSGRLDLKADEAVQVQATVRWVPSGDGGFWEVSCGST